MKIQRRTPRERWLFLAALGLCVMTRVALVAPSDPSRVMTRWSNMGDASLYDRFGWNLASRGVLGIGDRPSAFVMPGYPLLVAAVYRVAGHVPGAVRSVQVVLGLLTVLALGRLAGGLGGPRAETFAVAAGAFYPFFLYFVPEILTETLFLSCFSGMLFTATRLGRTGNLRDGVFHGICLAAAVMTRPVALAMEPGVLLLARPWTRERCGTRLAGLLFALGILCLAWGGWITRNRSVFGELVPFDTHGGFTLYGSQLIARGLDQETVVRTTIAELGYYRYDIEKGTLPGGPRGELEADRRARDRALEMIRQDRSAYFARIFKNVARLWLNLDFGEIDQKASGLGLVALAGWCSFLPVAILGLAGLGRAYRCGRPEIFAASLWVLAMTTLLFGLTHAGKRYRVATIDPVLLTLAAWEADQRLREWAARAKTLRMRSPACD